jgi:hypothetical protein
MGIVVRDEIGKVSTNETIFMSCSYRLLLHDSLQAVESSTVGRISRILRLQPNLFQMNNTDWKN